MPEASSFFMSRAAGDTLEQFGTKKACISGCDFDVVPATPTVPQEQVPFQEVAGLDAVQAECVLKMAKMKPGSATLFKPSKRTLGYGELRAAGFVKMESLVSECFPNATRANPCKHRIRRCWIWAWHGGGICRNHSWMACKGDRDVPTATPGGCDLVCKHLDAGIPQVGNGRALERH